MGCERIMVERRVCVIGAGRIGLPIAVCLAKSGCKVAILEIDEDKISMINSGTSPFHEPGMQEILEAAVNDGSLFATSEEEVISDSNTIISAIGTGVDESFNPDLTGIKSLVSLVGNRISKGALVLLKTTLPIGTTEVIARELSDISGLKVDEELLVAFSPERIVEGKAIEELGILPKIVGGVGGKSTERASEIMALFGGEIIQVRDSRYAEMCKLLDNSYRMTRFGFSADVAAVCSRNGINAFEVIEAANHDYPRNNIPLPSIGVSGRAI